jgi:hypothetical protein
MHKYGITTNDSNYDNSCKWRHITSLQDHEFQDFRPLHFSLAWSHNGLQSFAQFWATLNPDLFQAQIDS